MHRLRILVEFSMIIFGKLKAFEFLKQDYVLIFE